MNLLISGLLGILVPVAAWKKGSLQPLASAVSGIMVFLTGFAGLSCTLLMIASFLAISVVEKLLKPRVEHIERDNVLKCGPRDVVQVLANGGFGLAGILLYMATSQRCFLLVYAAAIAEALGDSVASSTGMAVQGPTYDICTMKKLSPGISGGISFAGTLSAFAACASVGLFAALTKISTLRGGIIITLASFLGVVADSILGSRLQRKNKCSVCGKVTEKNLHCGQETQYLSGLRHLNNDGVNAVSNMIAAVLAYGFCLL